MIAKRVSISCSRIERLTSCRSCQAEPSRNIAYMPRRIFASASSMRVDSWQQRMPLAMKALSAGPVSGIEKWPVTVLPALSVSPVMACVSSTELMMPGKFIISPRPTTSSRRISEAISEESIVLPASSKPGTAGTQEGVVSMALSGVRAASATIRSTPGRPMTLQISCGS